MEEPVPGRDPAWSRLTFWDLIAVAAMAVIIIVTSAEVTVRHLFGLGLQSADELSGYMLIVAAFFGLQRALGSQSSFKVDLFTRMMPARLLRRLDVLSELLNFLILMVFLLSFGFLTWTSYRLDSVSSTLLAFPLAVPQALCTLALFAAVLRSFALLISVCKARGN